MRRRKPKYKVLDKNDNVLIQGALLHEIIETIILNTVKRLEKEKSMITRIEKNYFAYFNVLSTIYQNSNHILWKNIEMIENLHNNKEFLNSNKFIKFKKDTFSLTQGLHDISTNNIRWKKHKKECI